MSNRVCVLLIVIELSAFTYVEFCCLSLLSSFSNFDTDPIQSKKSIVIYSILLLLLFEPRRIDTTRHATIRFEYAPQTHNPADDYVKTSDNVCCVCCVDKTTMKHNLNKHSNVFPVNRIGMLRAAFQNSE